MNILVTGGAGFVGSHVVRALLDWGERVVVLDPLIHGHRAAVDSRAHFVAGWASDPVLLLNTLRTHRVDAVIHLAGDSDEKESLEHPGKYYVNNLVTTLRVLDAMKVAGTKRLVFASCAGVYDSPSTDSESTESQPDGLDENAPTRPLHPYARSKLLAEYVIQDYARAHDLGYAILRYDEVAGAHPSGEIGEDHFPETHLLPRLLLAGPVPKGPVPKGEGTIELLHVMDLAEAYLQVLELIQPGRGEIYNVASGQRFEIRELIRLAEKVRGKVAQPSRSLAEGRRLSDAHFVEPAPLRSSPRLSTRKLESMGWKCERTLEQIVQDAWRWHSGHPHGYGERVGTQPGRRWDIVDEASWESFPASDPPSYSPTRLSGAPEQSMRH